MAPTYLMTDPVHFEVCYQINPWMKPDTWGANRATQCSAAITASRELAEAIRNLGGDIEYVGAVDGLPDLVFPANAAIVLDGRVLLARFRCAERQGEEPVFRAAFEQLKRDGLVTEVQDLPDSVFQEGAGDCIWDVDRGFFWVGYGQRSTETSVAVIENVFGEKTVALELASPRFYHLDTCFCPLAGGHVLYYPPAFTPDSLERLRAHVAAPRRIEATDEEAAAFCVNAVNIGSRIVMAKAPESLKAKLSVRGFQVTEVDLSPFILSGGAAYCMTLRLDRVSTERSARAAE